jgi:hypothetical protein
LYRAEENDGDNSFMPKIPLNLRNGSVAGSDHQDELIVTPFAQILASLKNVRQNFVMLSNDNKSTSTTIQEGSSSSCTTKADVSLEYTEILEELDWCLSQLESMQSHKTISDVASTKFKRMLNKELSHFAENNKSDHQISDFIINTYLEKNEDGDGEGQPPRFTGSMLNIHGLASLAETDSERLHQNKQQQQHTTTASSITISNHKPPQTQVQPTTTHSTPETSSVYFSLNSHDGSPEPVAAATTTTTAAVSTIPTSSLLSSNSDSNTKMNTIFAHIPSSTSTTVVATIAAGCPLKDQDDNEKNLSLSKYGLTSITTTAVKLDELDAIMSRLDLWGIDVFLIDELTLNRPLTAVAFSIFQV